MNNRYQDANFDIPQQNIRRQTASRPVQPARVSGRVQPTQNGRTVRRPVSHVNGTRPATSQRVQNQGANQGAMAVAINQNSAPTTPKKPLGVRIATGIAYFNKQVIRPLFTSKEKGMNTVEVTKKPFPFTSLLIGLLCTLFVAAMIFSYIQINEYTVQVSQLRSTVSDLMSADKELTSSLEQKNDMSVIEQKAEELGMVKADQLTKKHVNLTSEDKVEVIETKSSEDSSIVTTIMSGLFSNFDGLVDYFN